MSTARPMHHHGERVERNLIHSDRAMLITPGRLIAAGVGGVLKVAAGSSLLACSRSSVLVEVLSLIHI